MEPYVLVMAHQVKNLSALQETQEMQVGSPGREDPLEEDMAAHSSILAWRLLWKSSLVGYSPWGHKESDTTEGMSRHAHISKSELYKIICKNRNYYHRHKTE